MKLEFVNQTVRPSRLVAELANAASRALARFGGGRPGLLGAQLDPQLLSLCNARSAWWPAIWTASGCAASRAFTPAIEVTQKFDEVLRDPDIEGVVIATPVSTHYQLAKRCLEADKSVVVEKPLATSRTAGRGPRAPGAPARSGADGRAHL